MYRYGLNLRRYLLLMIVLFWTVLAFATADWETTFIAYVSGAASAGAGGAVVRREPAGFTSRLTDSRNVDVRALCACATRSLRLRRSSSRCSSWTSCKWRR